MPGGYLRGWQPLRQLPFSDIKPFYKELHQRGNCDVEVWMNDRYEVTVRIARGEESAGLRHLSINLLDRSPVRNWRHLQQLKNEVCGELWTGVEIFPPEDRLTDSANQYHLFCIPPGQDIGTVRDGTFVSIGLGAPENALVSDDEQVERWNEGEHPGRQEPWEDGLTTGRTVHTDESRKRLTEANREAGLT